MTILTKRGDSFSQIAILPDSFANGYFVGWTVSAQIRTIPYYNLVSELVCTWVDPVTTRQLTVSDIITKDWPISDAAMDLQFVRDSDGFTISTNTIPISIVHDITYDEVVV